MRMDFKLPIIAVIGNKKTGKTTLVELLVRAFTRDGLRIATVKHISLKNFSLDRKGTDTWRHYHAGAKKVISVSNSEIALLIRDIGHKFSLRTLEKFTEEIDLLLLEGFSEYVSKTPYVGKIICVKNDGELETYKTKIDGEIIAFCSLNSNKCNEVLAINKDKKSLVARALSFFRRSREILKILDSLPKINCKNCGYQTCERMAIAIYKKEAKLDDCDILHNKEKTKIKIEVSGEELPLNPFVSNMVYEVTMSMLRSLKRAPIEGEKRLFIKVA